MDEILECLDAPHGGCEGEVDYRMIGGSLRAFPRCEAHLRERLDYQEEINRRYAPYSDVPPADFDPTYAGERWDDEY